MDLNLFDLKYDCPDCGDDCTNIYVDAKCMVILNLDDLGEIRDHNTQYERFDLDSTAECSNPECRYRAPLRNFLGKSSRAELLVKLLRRGGWKVRAYSGRGMNGKECVGVDVDSIGQSVVVGAYLADQNPSEPSYDSMSRGFVVYWPDVPWMGVEEDDEGWDDEE